MALGGDRRVFLNFHYLACELAEIPFERHRDSDNLVARLNLPNMRYDRKDKVRAYAETVTDPDRLAEIGEWILDAEDGETFLRRLEAF